MVTATMDQLEARLEARLDEQQTAFHWRAIKTAALQRCLLFLRFICFNFIRLFAWSLKPFFAMLHQTEFPHCGEFNGRPMKTLVLDLDETLVHASSTPSIGSIRYELQLPVGGGQLASCIVYVSLRPHVAFFLRTVAQWYNVAIFTASLREYGDPVIDSLDPSRTLIAHRVFREGCDHRNGAYIKNLAKLQPNLASVVIVDNSPVAYTMQPANAIPIDPWTSDANDEALLDLLPFLYALRFTDDVRSVLSLRRINRSHSDAHSSSSK